MPGLPTTLAGMMGFIIFVGFIVGMIVPNLNSSDAEEIKSLQNDFDNNLNASVNGSVSTGGFWGFVGNVFGVNGVYDFIIGFFSIIISFAELVLAYLGIILGVSLDIPAVFYVLFAIMSSSLIIGVVKLIFFSGD